MSTSAPHPTFSLAAGVGLLSGAALGFEILLIRLLSIVDWHHLAFLVISLALLGYGASGTLLALGREWLIRHFEVAVAVAAAAFGVTSLAAFAISQRMELNSLEIFWSGRQFGNLFILYLLFAVPFFCAATSIGLALTRFGSESPRLYRADLIGAGASAALVTAALFVLHPVTALQLIAATGFLAATLFAPRRVVVALALVGVGGAFALRPVVLPLRISQFKELSHALRIPGARIVDERSSPLGLLTSVESRTVPFRHAPGLSLTFGGEIPEQIGIFTDGGGMTPIVSRAESESVDYLRFTPTAVAYHLAGPGDGRHVAVIGAGGGAEVLSALIHGAQRVTAVELNRQMVDLVASRFAAEAGDLYADPRVNVVTAEARQFIRETGERFDVIQIALVGSHGASAAGVQALAESYLYTVEAIAEMVQHLEPGGLLVVTRWMQSPPREVIKLLATAVEALEREPGPGGAPPSQRLALIRGWNTATVIIRNGGFAAAEVERLRQFADERSFDLDYAPGVSREETNQYNVLEETYLYDAVTALLAGGRVREDFYDRYKFHVRPATDERPYFFHSFRWTALPELLELRSRGGMPLLEWGYLVLVAGLVQAFTAAVVLILLPLLLVRRGGSQTRAPAWRLVVYFGSIGLAFLFVEIAFMQRLTLFLGNPLYAIAVVLTAFLFFGGIGSGVSARIGDRYLPVVPLIVAASALVGLVLVRSLTDAAVGLGGPVKIAISVALVAPLAFAMGMPFPLGLRRLSASDRTAIPWAWGINGTASVISSMLATLVALHFGFSILVALAAALYAFAAVGVPPGESR